MTTVATVPGRGTRWPWHLSIKGMRLDVDHDVIAFDANAATPSAIDHHLHFTACVCSRAAAENPYGVIRTFAGWSLQSSSPWHHVTVWKIVHGKLPDAPRLRACHRGMHRYLRAAPHCHAHMWAQGVTLPPVLLNCFQATHHSTTIT